MNLSPPHLIFLAGSLVYIGIRIRYQRRVRGTDKPVDRSTPLDRLLVLLVASAQGGLPLLLLFTPLLDGAGYTRPTAAMIAGVVLMPLGLLLFWRSHADLGTQWSVTLELSEGHRLVTHGVYRRLRHPMYAAFFILAVSQILLLHNAIAGPAALVAVTLLYLLRVPREDRMMAAAFGADYRAWRARTGALWPRLPSL
jgi:protein-S-isoprenylcysteine O-methyltransferase Ste14